MSERSNPSSTVISHCIDKRVILQRLQQEQISRRRWRWRCRAPGRPSGSADSLTKTPRPSLLAFEKGLREARLTSGRARVPLRRFLDGQDGLLPLPILAPLDPEGGTIRMKGRRRADCREGRRSNAPPPSGWLVCGLKAPGQPTMQPQPQRRESCKPEEIPCCKRNRTAGGGSRGDRNLRVPLVDVHILIGLIHNLLLQ